MTKKYLRILIYAAILYLPGVVFFATTSPEKLPVGFYIVPFLYIALVSYITTRFILTRLYKTTKYSHLLPTIVAVLITLMLLLGSLQQLSGRDVLLVVGIGAILVWYIRKLSS